MNSFFKFIDIWWIFELEISRCGVIVLYYSCMIGVVRDFKIFCDGYYKRFLFVVVFDIDFVWRIYKKDDIYSVVIGWFFDWFYVLNKKILIEKIKL